MYGFAAANIGCCGCYELTFGPAGVPSYYGGELEGRKMVVQVTNRGDEYVLRVVYSSLSLSLSLSHILSLFLSFFRSFHRLTAVSRQRYIFTNRHTHIYIYILLLTYVF